MKQYNLGVVVGRFQVDELHEAHSTLIKTALKECEHVLILVGTTVVRDSKKNPLDFLARGYMIKNQFPYESISIVPMADNASDDAWDNGLDAKIAEYATGEVRLYSGREGFHTSYGGKYRHNVTIIDEVSEMAGTLIRAQIGKQVLRTGDFRRGVIFANMSKYPKVHPTVDIAVLRKDPKVPTYYTHVALGKKPGEKSWRFPGGFADPTDANFNASARREAREELLGIEIGTPEYITNMKIDDWRYRNEENKIITTFFKADYIFGSLEAGDDLAIAEWISLDNLFINIEINENPSVGVSEKLMINPGHHQLMKALFENLIKNGQYIPPARNS